MAQTGFTPILIYSSSTTTNAPAAGNLTNSTLGSELAINITDGKLFYKDNANAVQVIAWKVTPTTAGGTGLTSYTAGDLLYYATGTTLTKLAIGSNKTILTSSGTAPQWSASLDTTQGGTGVTSYAAGDLVYYATGTTFTKLAIGANTTILTSSGTAPQWTTASSVTIGTATNLAGGAQGSIPYQSGAATTVFLAKDTNATRYLANTGTSNNPAWAQIDLTNGVTGDLPYSNLAQGSALSVLGVTGNATADVASIAAGTDNQVLRRSGTSLAFGAVNLASTDAVTGTLPVGNGGTGNTTGAATAVKSNATTGLMEIAGPAASTTRVMTIPNANFTAARTDAAQTFTGDQTFGSVILNALFGNLIVAGTIANGITFTFTAWPDTGETTWMFIIGSNNNANSYGVAIGNRLVSSGTISLSSVVAVGGSWSMSGANVQWTQSSGSSVYMTGYYLKLR